MVKVREHPIIFSTDSVRAILESRKSVTRRVIKPQPTKPLIYRTVKGRPELEYWYEPDNDFNIARAYDCPYGQVGDRLWVKETWATIKLYDDLPPKEIKPVYGIWYKATEDNRYGPSEINPWPEGNRGKWRSSLFMPRKFSRIDLEITGLRVERLQEISSPDIHAEGLPNIADYPTPIQWFIATWDSLNAKRGYSWETNPWVWVIEFKRL